MRKIAVVALIDLLLLPVSLLCQVARTSEKDFAANYDAFIRQAMEKIPEVPGFAIAVVKDDKPIFVRAYGVADKEAGAKATTDTLFYIGSTTKPFTAMLAALLDREGKIKLDDPMTKYTSGLTFKAPIPDKVTVRSLLTHTSGLRDYPLVFRMAFSGQGSEQDMYRVFADALTYDDSAFGKYAYNNLGYNIYGLLAKRTLNQKWQDLLQERIFAPAGMKHTTAYLSKASAAKWPVAKSYLYDADTTTIVRSPLDKADNTMHSAGGIVTTAPDMARWLILNMNDGKLDGKQVIPADIVRSVHTGYTKTSREGQPFVGEGEYGLGWQIGKYKGEKVVYHHGGYQGWQTHMSYLPDKKIGVVVMANESSAGGPVGHTIATYALEWWMGTPDVDNAYAAQIDTMVKMYGQFKEAQIASVRDRAKRTWQLTRPLADYTGTYTDDIMGTIEITVEKDTLVAKMGNMRAVSTPFTQKDSIRVELMPGQGEVISFNANADGKVDSLNYGSIKFLKVKG